MYHVVRIFRLCLLCRRTCSFWEAVTSPQTPQLSWQESFKTQYNTANLDDVLPPQLKDRSKNGTSNALAARHFLFTTDEGFIGLGPLEMQSGDIVCLLFGATPCVLRKLDSGTYRFIRACYIYEIMSGEALVDLPKERIENFVMI